MSCLACSFFSNAARTVDVEETDSGCASSFFFPSSFSRSSSISFGWRGGLVEYLFRKATCPTPPAYCSRRPLSPPFVAWRGARVVKVVEETDALLQRAIARAEERRRGCVVRNIAAAVDLAERLLARGTVVAGGTERRGMKASVVGSFAYGNQHYHLKEELNPTWVSGLKQPASSPRRVVEAASSSVT